MTPKSEQANLKNFSASFLALVKLDSLEIKNLKVKYLEYSISISWKTYTIHSNAAIENSLSQFDYGAQIYNIWVLEIIIITGKGIKAYSVI